MRQQLGVNTKRCGFLSRECDSGEYKWEPLCK
jgi:hypothetical protein